MTLLLCDAAQAVGGKLYILGAAWNTIQVPNVPIPMALAVRVVVPWDQSNQPFDTHMRLVNAEGEPVDLGMGPIEARTKVEVGRPAGVRPGSPLVAVLALNAGPLALPPGVYVWELALDGTEMAREIFEVREQPQTGA